MSSIETETIILGADHGGYHLKEQLSKGLKERGYRVQDVGCYSADSVDYPIISQKLALALKENPASRGVLCCGSGLGISIAANRFPWVRAIVAHDHHTAVMSRRHNDANAICFGGRVIAPELAQELLDTWLNTPFDGGRHQHRVDLMNHIQDGVTTC